MMFLYIEKLILQCFYINEYNQVEKTDKNRRVG